MVNTFPGRLAKVSSLISTQANLPNLRRLFVESRTEAEENEYSRNAVGADILGSPLRIGT
jgi:hypothetical protein